MRHVAMRLVSLWLCCLPLSAGATEVFWDPSSNGQIVIEAESYASADAQWIEESTVAGFAGASYMRATNGGPPFCSDHTCAASAPAMTYSVDFPAAGTWKVWLRGYGEDGGSDSAHAGIDGVVTLQSARIAAFGQGAWAWSQSTISAGPAVIQVPSAGLHSFQIFRREFDFRLDKIVLVQESATPALIDPTGTGPSETPDVVPSAFDEIGLTALGGLDYDVTVWGRLYEFRGGPIPSSVYTQGTRLLKHGGNSIPSIRRPGGAWDKVTWTQLSVIEQRNQRVVLEGQGTAGPNLEVTCRTTVEYDGMLRYDLTLEAAGASVEITDVLYSNNLDKEATALFSKHVEYDFANLNIDKDQLLNSAGDFPEDTTIAYTPSLFAGDRDIGMEFWFPSNADWDTDPEPIRLVNRPTDTVATLQVFPLRGASHVLADGESWTDTWAMFPMPMRPDPLRRKRRFGPASTFVTNLLALDNSLYDLHQVTSYGSGFALWEPRNGGLPRGKRDGSGALLANQAAVLSYLDTHDVAYVPYGFLMLAPFDPVADANRSSWRANGNDQPFTGLGPPDSYFACAGRGDYFAWYRDRTLDDLRTAPPDEPIAGLYFDHGSGSRMCVNSPELVGKPAGSQIWEYFEVRDAYKRLYESIDREGLGVIVTSHHNGAPKALGAFIDVAFVGEALNVPFCDRDADPNTPRCFSYVPDYHELPDGWLDAMLYPNAGATTTLLPQVRRCNMASWVPNPQPCPDRQRELHTLTLANDYPVWWAVSHLIPQTGVPLDHSTGGIYQAADLVGSLADTDFLGWWEAGAKAVPSAAGGDVKASVYANGQTDKALVVVANLGTTTATQVDVTLDLGALGLATSGSHYRNPEKHGQPGGDSSAIVGGVVEADADIPARDFQLILVEPAPYVVP